MTIPDGCFIEYLEEQESWLAHDSEGRIVLRYREDTGRITFALIGAPIDLVEAFIEEIRSSKPMAAKHIDDEAEREPVLHCRYCDQYTPHIKDEKEGFTSRWGCLVCNRWDPPFVRATGQDHG